MQGAGISVAKVVRGQSAHRPGGKVREPAQRKEKKAPLETPQIKNSRNRIDRLESEQNQDGKITI